MLSRAQNIVTILSNGKAVIKRFRIERMLPRQRFSSASVEARAQAGEGDLVPGDEACFTSCRRVLQLWLKAKAKEWADGRESGRRAAKVDLPALIIAVGKVL